MSRGEHGHDGDEGDVLMHLHSIIRRHDRIVGVYQRALATSDSDCGLQVAALSAWG